ncbi:MAG: TIGR02186 family protein [Rhodospirillaceae bacterium]|nr:TIGR02186 family protein [Rhodospirillaceae bacterium]
MIALRSFVVLGLVLLGAPTRAQEAPLVADVSENLVAITAGFTGKDVLLFGATDGPGDIAVVVKGPARDIVVRKKDRFGPIWINSESMTFRDVPSFYRIASSRPLEEFAPPNLLSRFQIGTGNLRLDSAAENLSPEDLSEFRQALIRLKTGQGLFDEGLGAVNTTSNRLFRTQIHFPANVPTGTYIVEVYLFRNGTVASAEIVPFNISKTGFGAEVYDFAHDFAPLYGLLAIALAVGAGWAASAAFRRA